MTCKEFEKIMRKIDAINKSLDKLNNMLNRVNEEEKKQILICMEYLETEYRKWESEVLRMNERKLILKKQ